MDSTYDELDFSDSPFSSSKEDSFLGDSTPISFGLASASSSASTKKSKRTEHGKRNLAYSGISHQTSRSTLLSAQDSQIGDGDIEDNNVSHVSVVVRVRPLSDMENKRNDNNSVTFHDDTSISVDNDGKAKTFTFNAIFDPTTSQQEVVDRCGIKRLVDKSLEGYSCTAFAYGQTGSGKTFTITGPVGNDEPVNYGDNYGLIQRSFMYLFDMVQERKKTVNYTLSASYLEIYNEQVKDLLNPFGRDSLPVRWSKDKGFYVENLFVVDCETSDDILAVLEEGMSQRQIAHNNINEYSSRSHTIMSLQIDFEVPDPDDENLYISKHGRLSFVDLAGSEKVKELGSHADLLTETTNINKSLLTLGNCISALGDSRKRNGHIPYRDSKLTKLLADSLGGTGITLMIACVSPSKYCVPESLNTLRYANRARRIKNKPVVRMDPREKLILSLKREVKLLRNENQYLRERLKFPKGPAQASIRDKSSPEYNGENGSDQNGSPDDGEKMPVPMEKKLVKRQSTNSSLASSILSPKSAADNSLYEMLQEYMLENETLRSENTDLHNVKLRARREHEHLSNENDKLLRKLETLERVFATSPVSVPGKLLSRTTSGHSTSTSSDMTLTLESVSSTPQNMTPTNPLPPSPWRQQQPIGNHANDMQIKQRQQQPIGNHANDIQMKQQDRFPSATSGVSVGHSPSSQLPPVDNVKGVPNGYRSNQQPQYSPPLSNTSVTPTNHGGGAPLRQIYQGSPQQTPGPLQGKPQHSYPPTSSQKGPKKFSDGSKTSDISRSFPPPSNNFQGSPVSTASTLSSYPEGGTSNHGNNHHKRSPSLPAGGGGQPARPRDVAPMAATTHHNKPGPVVDNYRPAPTTSSTTSTNSRRGSKLSRKSRKLKSYARSDPLPKKGDNPRNENKSLDQASTKPQKTSTRKLPHQSASSNVATGYGNRAGAAKGTGNHPPAVSQSAVQSGSAPASNGEKFDAIPATPAATPPPVKYKPKGTSDMLAKTSNLTKPPPDSGSLKTINEKLRQELQDLDGEIEYMKYVNKNQTAVQPNVNTKTKGKKR